jgi:transposase
MPLYSPKQKDAVIRKMLQPDAPSVLALSSQLGISKATLYRWLNQSNSQGKTTQDTMEKRPLDWTPEERFQAVMETSALSGDELGKYVRQKGITRQQLQEWKNDCLQAIGNRTGRKPDTEKRDLKRQITQLEREIRRKDKALAETAALLVLKKKAQELWGDYEDS